MTGHPRNETERAWYREPYVWMLIFFPALAVVAGAITLRLAIVSDDGLVTDDYYRKGLEINRVLERDERARQYGLVATIVFRPDAGHLGVILRGNAGFTVPPSIGLRFMHATRAGFDREMTATLGADGGYAVEVRDLAAGHWHLQIEAGDWRLLESLHVGGATPRD